jgi:mono/diheme cytochrome c family protein
MKTIKYPVLFSIGTLLASLASGAEELNQPRLTTGKQLYEYHCSVCHQPNGHGNAEKGYPSLIHTTLRSWQIRHKINGDEALSRKMPSFKDISKSKAKLISDYIRTLK